MILTILPFTALDAAGARNAPQLGVKAPSRHAIEPMLHFHFVHSLQIHPQGRKHAAC